MKWLAVNLLTISLLGVGGPLRVQAANSFSTSIEVQASSLGNAVASQSRIDQTHEKTQALLAEYSIVTRELESLRRYDTHLERMVQEQLSAIAALEQQLEDVVITHREVVPLMSRMVESLSRFVELDLPFLTEERQQRVAELHDIIDSPAISVAEKYRRILEAYRIETEYGRTVEAYRGSLGTSEGLHTVEYLRVGRVSLIYRTLDGSEAKVWDQNTSNWFELPDSYRISLTKAFRVARKQAAPDLLKLPVSAPESSL